MQSRKPQGSRLRPVADPLDRAGFVTKGDRMYVTPRKHVMPLSAHGTNAAGKGNTPPSVELSKLLLSLRKLREGMLAASKATPVAFAQRVHVFSIRLSILAHHPPSYSPSLEHTLERLHSKAHPLPAAEVKELVTYLILDYACRQEAMASAFELRARARREHGFHSQVVDLMNWAVDRMRRHALKAVGSAYLNVHVSWVVGGCTGGDGSWTWEKLVDTENLGWEREGDKIVIRRPKTRPAPTPAST
ncbi:hypothetical protein N7468_004413 [Penicillium chermesinum]|uniref:Uncharacterized protein n=1 Tax=Penicillium chermesinum TaxID=63820 RepID=A0A9W9P897_9EURO|nr:uncharacterized protein N7468_004413 [Penicillium chermesinum]KAJ5239794.1 hypothetical protein N7468_004413 [Penicillium chermesinum]